MKRNYLLILFLCLLACDQIDSNELDPIDSVIQIEVRELLEPGVRTLTFYCATERIYECSNYFISTETTSEKGSVEVLFKSVDIGLTCFTSLGSAKSIVDLGVMPNGSYPVVFRNGSLMNEGMLAISDEQITLDFSRTNGIEIVRPVTRRVPDNTYWGTIGYATGASANLVYEFLGTLSNHGAVFSEQVPGHYYYYEIDDRGDIVIDVEKSGYHFAGGVIFSYQGNESNLRALIQSEGAKLRDELSINIQTSSGTTINNWQQ